MVKKGFDDKGLELVSLKLKAATKCGDPRMLVDAMKFHPKAEDVNMRDCALEGSELLVPPNANSTYHQVLIVILIDPIK